MTSVTVASQSPHNMKHTRFISNLNLTFTFFSDLVETLRPAATLHSQRHSLKSVHTNHLSTISPVNFRNFVKYYIIFLIIVRHTRFILNLNFTFTFFSDLVGTLRPRSNFAFSMTFVKISPYESLKYNIACKLPEFRKIVYFIFNHCEAYEIYFEFEFHFYIFLRSCRDPPTPKQLCILNDIR